MWAVSFCALICSGRSLKNCKLLWRWNSDFFQFLFLIKFKHLIMPVVNWARKEILASSVCLKYSLRRKIGLPVDSSFLQVKSEHRWRMQTQTRVLVKSADCVVLRWVSFPSVQIKCYLTNKESGKYMWLYTRVSSLHGNHEKPEKQVKPFFPVRGMSGNLGQCL